MLSALLSLALAASPAADTDQEDQADLATEAVKPAKPAKDSPDYVRCKRMLVTGTNIRKKVCQTNAAWDRMAQKGNNAAREIMENANGGYTKSN